MKKLIITIYLIGLFYNVNCKSESEVIQAPPEAKTDIYYSIDGIINKANYLRKQGGESCASDYYKDWEKVYFDSMKKINKYFILLLLFLK